MRFLLQRNIWNEPAYDRLLESIRQRSQYQEVELIPFTRDFVQPVEKVADVVFGSNRFVEVCRAKGYPVFRTFDPDYTSYPAHYWMNSRGAYHRLGSLQITAPVFIKPRTEKFFTGTVVERQADLERIQYASCDNPAEEEVWVAPPVAIGEEVRIFVVGGRAVTASRYRLRGEVRPQHIADPAHPALGFAREVLTHGAADDAFVMDVGETGEGWRIVELNNINSSGLYQCDTGALVEALEAMRG